MPKGVRGSGVPRVKRSELERLLDRRTKLDQQLAELQARERSKETDALIGRALREHAEKNPEFKQTMHDILDTTIMAKRERKALGLDTHAGAEHEETDQAPSTDEHGRDVDLSG